MAGYVHYPKLPGYYGAADIFLHAAQYEPWGISVSEAMALGFVTGIDDLWLNGRQNLAVR